MAFRNEGSLQKTFLAGAAIGANRIVKIGATDPFVIQGAAATDKLIGVSEYFPAAINDTVDVILDGTALIKLGGTVLAGDLVTSDATGQGLATTTAANRYIGFALEGGVIGDLIGVRIAPGLI